MIDMPSSSCSRFSSSRICAWIVTSSAVVGSSAMSSFGSHESAIAIITRWRIPPESWCGYSSMRRSGSGMPTSSSISIARSRAAFLLRPWCSRSDSDDLVAHLEDGVQRRHRLLEDHRDVVAADRPHAAPRSPSPDPPRRRRSGKGCFEPILDLARRRGISRITESDVTDLPLPDSPTIPSVSPGLTWNETPSTARATPASVRKYVLEVLYLQNGL
jgi:hypothetical protein